MKFRYNILGGAVASWLVRSSPDRAVRVRALAGDVVLFSWERHFTLTVPLSTQVYKWVPVNLKAHLRPRVITVVRFCFEMRYCPNA